MFRDLGIAFGVALLGIFLVLRIQTGLSATTFIIMLAIPLSVIGIMPGFWLLNQFGERMVDGFSNPVLFTATAMIGMIALAGIVVRNSLILVEFVEQARARGMAVRPALLEAGRLRTLAIFDKPDPLDGPFFEDLDRSGQGAGPEDDGQVTGFFHDEMAVWDKHDTWSLNKRRAIFSILKL